MTIIIEDGTGLDDSQAYCDFDFYIGFVAEMGMPSTYTREQIEPALVTASKRWIDWQHEFAGDKLVETQALDFPRDNDIGLPLKIKQAAAYAAWLHLNDALLVNTTALSTAGDVVSESKTLSVMSTSKTYAEGSAQTYSRVLPAELENLLRPYLKLSTGFGRVVRVM
jgi:hypothetical protein